MLSRRSHRTWQSVCDCGFRWRTSKNYSQYTLGHTSIDWFRSLHRTHVWLHLNLNLAVCASEFRNKETSEARIHSFSSLLHAMCSRSHQNVFSGSRIHPRPAHLEAESARVADPYRMQHFSESLLREKGCECSSLESFYQYCTLQAAPASPGFVNCSERFDPPC